MAAGRALLPLLAAAMLLEPAAAVWPQPQAQRSPPGGGRCPLSPRRFQFAYAGGSAVGPGCAVLEAAFQRYRALLFAAARPTGEAGRGLPAGRGARRAGPLALLPVALFLKKKPAKPNPRLFWVWMGDQLFSPLIASVQQGLGARGGGGCALMVRGLESGLIAQGSVVLLCGGRCLWHARFKIKYI